MNIRWLLTGLCAALCAAPSLAGEAKAPELDAKFVKLSAPDKVVTDEVFRASITMKNTGSKTWAERQGFVRLYAVAPDHNKRWGTTYIILGQGRKIAPGATCTFGSWLRAPSEPGEYVFQWRVGEHRGGKLLGEPSEAKKITVEEPAKKVEEPKPPVQPKTGKQILTFDHFEYAGSFKLPRKGMKGDPPFSSSGLTMRKMKDGTKRVFVRYFKGPLFEAEVPALVKVKGTDHKGLKVAALKKIWGSPKVGGVGQNAGYWWDEENQTLWWSTFHPYWTGGSKRPSLGGSKLGKDGKITHIGPWRVTRAPFKGYWGGVTVLSEEFAKKYTGGRKIALGFGGYYSICAPTSWGPTLGAIATPDPKKNIVDVLPLVDYPFAKGVRAPRDGNYLVANCDWGGDPPKSRYEGTWTMRDTVPAGVFIDLPKVHGFIAFVSLGTGRMGYDYGTITCAGRTNWWYSYDPAELGKAAKGERSSAGIPPFAMERVVYPLETRELTNSAPVTGACFDPADRLLYLLKQRSIGGRYPAVHVYRVKPIPAVKAQKTRG